MVHMYRFRFWTTDRWKRKDALACFAAGGPRMSTWYHTLRDAGTSADYFKSVSSNPADVNAAAVDTKANTKNDATKGIAARRGRLLWAKVDSQLIEGHRPDSSIDNGLGADWTGCAFFCLIFYIGISLEWFCFSFTYAKMDSTHGIYALFTPCHIF
jgi:hypothetical protein